jgi:hypothetical protein
VSLFFWRNRLNGDTQCHTQTKTSFCYFIWFSTNIVFPVTYLAYRFCFWLLSGKNLGLTLSLCSVLSLHYVSLSLLLVSRTSMGYTSW